MDRIHTCIKRLLEYVGFNKIAQTPVHVEILSFDFLICSCYYIVSVICILVQKASFIALLLNGLCLMRKIFKNTINNSEITSIISGVVNLKLKICAKSYFFYMAVFQGITGFAALANCIYFWSVTAGQVKFFSALFILLVYVDDLVDLFACAFEAEINPIN